MIELSPLPITGPAGRLPSWDRGELKHRACPVCGLDQPVGYVRRPDGMIVHRCDGCTMLYLADVPSPDALNQFYLDYGAFKGYSQAPGWIRRRLRFLVDPHASILRQNGGLLGARVLEVGCSYGQLLTALRAGGASVGGVEIDERARSSLRERGIPAFRDLQNVDGTWDVVMCIQLLEHVIGPSQMLQLARQHVRKGGRVLISVPNAGETLQAGPSWIGFRVDLEHLNYFSLPTLSRTLHACGIEVTGSWEHLEPDLGQCPSWSVRISNLRHAAKQILTAKEPPMAKGSFVLTVLGKAA